MWGPVLGWCALQLLAESIDPKNPTRTALDLFDRLRLRAPFAHAFAALGFEGEEAWRVAGRIKVLLLVCGGIDDRPEPEPPSPIKSSTTHAKIPPPAPAVPKRCDEGVALAPALWLDPDVRWLTGAHEAEGHTYFIHERYEELLWWLLMPSLLRLAGEAVPNTAKLKELSDGIHSLLASAKKAGYRVDVLLGSSQAPAKNDSPATGPFRQPAEDAEDSPDQEKESHRAKKSDQVKTSGRHDPL
jgi:hypothetical protein